MLGKDLGLEQGNSLRTPAVHDVTEEELEPLDSVQRQRRSNFTHQSLANLKRSVRNLKKKKKNERQWRASIQSWRNGRRSDDIFRFRLGGCKETRKSSSAGVTLPARQSHLVKAYTCKQKIIARSSAEAELYAAALGASESKGIVSLLKDLGYEMKPVLAIDANATEHIFR